MCRVFHKGKADNSAKLIMYESTVPSLTLASSSPTNQNTTPSIGYNQLLAPFSSSMATHHHHHHHIPNQSQNNNNNSLMGLLQFSRETNTNNSSTVTQISPKCDDNGYGFLWDMDLEENSFHDGGASNLDGMRFEVDNNNSVVLL